MTTVNYDNLVVEIVLKKRSHDARVKPSVPASGEGHRDRSLHGKPSELPTTSLDRVKIGVLVPAALRVFRIEQRLYREENQASRRVRYDRSVSAKTLALTAVPLRQLRPAKRGLHRHTGSHVVALGLEVPTDVSGHYHPKTHTVTRPEVSLSDPNHLHILAETTGESS